MNVQAQQAQATCRASADAIQELQRLAHQVVVGLVVLMSQVALETRCERRGERERENETGGRMRTGCCIDEK